MSMAENPQPKTNEERKTPTGPLDAAGWFLVHQAGHQVWKLVIAVWVLILFLPLAGVYLIIQECKETLPQLSTPEPQVCSCLDVLQGRIPEYSHVSVTNFVIDRDRLVTDYWMNAWVPLLPADPIDEPSPLQVVVQIHLPMPLSEVEQLAASNRIQGVLVRGDRTLTFTEKMTLSTGPRQIDSQRCYFLQHGKEPPSRWRVYLLIGLGGVMVVVGSPISYWAWRIMLTANKK